MPWTYILECDDGTYYVGSTVDLEMRMGQHQAGEGALYTKRRLPVKLRWAAEFARVDEAFLWEKRIHGWGRAKRDALVDGRYEDLPLLASRSREALANRCAGPEEGKPGTGTQGG